MLSVPKGADYCKNSVIRYKKPLTDEAVGGFAAGRSPLSVPKGADYRKNSVIRYKNPTTDQAVGGFAAGRSPLFRRVRFSIAFTVKKCYNTADEYYSHFSG